VTKKVTIEVILREGISKDRTDLLLDSLLSGIVQEFEVVEANVIAEQCHICETALSLCGCEELARSKETV
jgi:hypothetical protein